VRILDTYWFHGGGIVKVEDPYVDCGYVYYIKGISEMTTTDMDSRDIALWGNSFPKDAGDALFGVK